MADNIPITPGAGAVVATDAMPDGRHYQRVKLTDGAPDSEHHASVRADGTLEVILSDMSAALHAMFDALVRPISQEPGTGRQRVTVEAGTLPTVTTVTTVTSITNFGGVSIAGTLLPDTSRNLWNNSVRRNIL